MRVLVFDGCCFLRVLVFATKTKDTKRQNLQKTEKMGIQYGVVSGFGWEVDIDQLRTWAIRNRVGSCEVENYSKKPKLSEQCTCGPECWKSAPEYIKGLFLMVASPGYDSDLEDYSVGVSVVQDADGMTMEDLHAIPNEKLQRAARWVEEIADAKPFNKSKKQKEDEKTYELIKKTHLEKYGEELDDDVEEEEEKKEWDVSDAHFFCFNDIS